jgi:aspartate aminotransferase
MDFCAQLLEREKVAVVPGIAFGADDYVRISYATSMENLEKGLARIENFAKTLV